MKIVEFLEQTADGKMSLDEQKKFLTQKPFGDSKELAEAVNYLYTNMSEAPKLEGAIDVCGTGGSGLDRINTSTISAFLLAALGVPVAKHGNNSSSGKFGSFDLLNALDVPTNLSAEEFQLRFNQYNLAFLYAKTFHPTMRHFALVRKEIGHPTFFNILGPLLSPIRAQRQIIGVSKKEYAMLIAKTAQEIGKKRVIVVNGSDGLDDVTLSGSTNVVELKNGEISEYVIKPEDFGIPRVTSFSEIASSSAEENITIAEAILKGQCNTRHKDLVLVNTAIALYLDDEKINLKDAFKKSEAKLKSGEAYKILENYRRPTVLNNIISRTKNRKFEAVKAIKKTIKKYNGGIIAEIKKTSPSEGELGININIERQARIYEQYGASAISVLTEPYFFSGSFADMKKVSENTYLPILCKDFILSEAHIDKAKSSGADIILLIVAALSESRLSELYKYAIEQQLQVLVEVHTKNELDKALTLNPEIIGINNRNLHDFSLNPELFEELRPLIPNNILVIAESGISYRKDIPNKADGILVGSVLMKHPFPKLKLKELNNRPILKLCGIRNAEDAKICEELNVDMIGINFVPRSRRKVDIVKAKQIVSQCNETITVGVFEDQPFDEINHIASEVGFDAIQLSGDEKDFSKINLPIIKTISAGQEIPKGAFLTIIDNKISGSGKPIDRKALKINEPSLIAGGVDISAAKTIIKEINPIGIDTASGIETDGRVDRQKIIDFAKLFS